MPVPTPLPPPLNPRSYTRPSQQPHRRKDEDENDQLVFRTIALKASGENIFLLCAGADGEVVLEAEFLGTVVAGPRLDCCSRRVGSSLAGAFGVVEGDDGGVGEAGAFAEGGWCWGWVVSCVNSRERSSFYRLTCCERY